MCDILAFAPIDASTKYNTAKPSFEDPADSKLRTGVNDNTIPSTVAIIIVQVIVLTRLFTTGILPEIYSDTIVPPRPTPIIARILPILLPPPPALTAFVLACRSSINAISDLFQRSNRS